MKLVTASGGNAPRCNRVALMRAFSLPPFVGDTHTYFSKPGRQRRDIVALGKWRCAAGRNRSLTSRLDGRSLFFLVVAIMHMGGATKSLWAQDCTPEPFDAGDVQPGHPAGGWRNGSPVLGESPSSICLSGIAISLEEPEICSYENVQACELYTWYQNDYWRIGNTDKTICNPDQDDPDPHCIDFWVRENGCGGEDPDNQDGGYGGVWQYRLLSTPPENWNGGWKLWFDTECVLVDENGVSHGACQDRPGGIKEPRGQSPVSVAVMCRDPVNDVNYNHPNIAAFAVPSFPELTRFEGEFYLPTDATICKPDEAGNTYIILRIIAGNDADTVGDARCEGPHNALWRRVRIRDVKLQPLYFDSEQFLLGLRDYMRLAATRGSTTNKPVLGSVSITDTLDMYPLLRRGYTISDIDYTVDFAELWHPSPSFAEEAAITGPFFFVPSRPDEVLPWTVPAASEAADTFVKIESASVDATGGTATDRHVRKWIAVHNPEDYDVEHMCFSLPDGWKIYAVVYEPLQIASQALACKDGWDGDDSTSCDGNIYQKAYRVRPAYLHDVTEECSQETAVEFPIWASSSRSYVIDIPPEARPGIYQLKFESGSYSDWLRVALFRKSPSEELPDSRAVLWDNMPLIDYQDATEDGDRSTLFSYLSAHGVTHLYASIYRYDWNQDDLNIQIKFNSNALADVSDSGLSVITSGGDTWKLTPDNLRYFEGVTEKANYQICTDPDCYNHRMFEESRVGVITVADVDVGGAYSGAGADEVSGKARLPLGVGDYLACETGKTAALARVGYIDTEKEMIYLDVPFPTGHCYASSGTKKFFRVKIDGYVDQEVMRRMGVPPESDDPHSQREFCPRLLDDESIDWDGLYPIVCDKPLVEFQNMTLEGDGSAGGSTTHVISLRCYDYNVNADGVVVHSQRSDACVVEPLLSAAQLAIVDMVADAMLEVEQQDGRPLGTDHLFFAGNDYDETHLWFSNNGEFDGFGQGQLGALIRRFQTKSIRTITTVTGAFLANWNATALKVDSDGDGTLDYADSCPFDDLVVSTDSDDETEATPEVDSTASNSCWDVGPYFHSNFSAFASAYTDQLIARFIPQRHREFEFSGGYSWALRSPISNRAQGILWRMVSDERPGSEISGPNFMLYPGVNISGSAPWRGTRDTLPLLIRNGAPEIYEELTIMFADYGGSYAEWSYGDESVAFSMVADSLADAELALVKKLDLSIWSQNAPNGEYFFYGATGLFHSVCTFDALLNGMPYRDTHEHCGDFLSGK